MPQINNSLNIEFEKIITKLKHLNLIQTLKGKSSLVKNISTPSYAEKGDISFAYNKKDLQTLENKEIGILIIDEKIKDLDLTPFKSIYSSPNPLLLQTYIVNYFCNIRDYQKTDEERISSNASIHPSAKIGKDTIIGHYVVIGKNVTIGNKCTILANTVIEFDTEISDFCIIQSHVFIGQGTKIAENVTIDSGTKIGTEGFSFYRDKDNNTQHIPHVGIVIIEKNCSIGGNCCIDRAKYHETRIKEGSRIDNLCQIAHNVIIGKNCIICGFCGIGGSTIIEDNVTLAAKVGVQDHIRIAAGTIIAGNGMVRQSITKKGIYAGDPCVERSTYLKNMVTQKKLHTLNQRIEKCENK